ncbi:CheR family methyltransferase [Murimonas intestini]|uniref:protein-glutamate O-methyltransferase n=1 Tax=Murimonas intestini TaxID=1337051 RepID=A0AB73T332_9FIRM|nr:protein-glutamate O-methyltransferase CheR [Murimonas intestini]MCR1841710.1 protein-glutamate O-methyltransferase CheR [Murimonas intestini]MCR1865527.1 protein-glutamate O-methyltransferase CheR [Murimonas intestini]MCR1883892.1 protein-glutamate O-methyltransferase CheR [Murimonas intestini]
MIRLEDREFEYIVQYAKEKYGLNLEKKRVLVECRLKGELEKHHVSSFSEYLVMISRDRSGKMAEDMISRLTTHYTYFMREFKHFELIRDVILPEVSRKQMPSVYSVWCAGCSTGQECYTLEMTLEEYRKTGSWMPVVMMLATDISEPVLKQAQSGIYKLKELESIPPAWRERYCTVGQDQTFQIKEALRTPVRFRKQNLKDYVQEKEQFDLILCRNVMIYFDTADKRRLVRELEKSLRPGGYLLVGHSELLPKDETSLNYVGSAAYRKE